MPLKSKENLKNLSLEIFVNSAHEMPLYKQDYILFGFLNDDAITTSQRIDL